MDVHTQKRLQRLNKRFFTYYHLLFITYSGEKNDVDALILDGREEVDGSSLEKLLQSRGGADTTT